MIRDLIVLAAGKGSRMGELTSDRPKLSLELGSGVTLGDTVSHAVRNHVWDRKIIVVGHGEDNVVMPDFEKVKNVNFESTNMAYSLWIALNSLNKHRETVVLYGDIIVDQTFLEPLISSTKDVTVASVANFRDIWRMRFTNPEKDAESFERDEFGRLKQIGKPIESLEAPDGQYSGAMKFSPKKMAEIVPHLSEFVNDRPGGFLTEFLQSLINKGEELFTVDAEGVWFEVDSSKDLEFALESHKVKKILGETMSWKKSPFEY